MRTLKIAFVGMGSIGRRHLRNAAAYLDSQNRPYQIDLYRSGCGAPLDEEAARRVRKTFLLDEDSVPSDYYDVVFVTNPTSLHYAAIRRFAPFARAFFIEKPVFDRAEPDLAGLGLSQEQICYVACPLRYHPVLDYVRRNVPCDRAYAVRAICSSYLPDWRPGTDYRACYSAHREMGGGVGIDLIHEWDYLTMLFGCVKEGKAYIEKISSLQIDSDDIAVYIARTERTVIELHLDYFGRESIRQMQIFLPDDTVVCDILGGSVRYLSAKRQLDFDCRRDTYQMNEIGHFFDIVDGKCQNDSDISGALRVLRYARGEF